MYCFPNMTQRSDPAFQRRIEDALREIDVYKINVSDLYELFRENRDDVLMHSDIYDNIRNTVDQSLVTLERAKELVDKQRVKSASRWWRKGTISKKWKDYEQLQRVMEENNGKVQDHLRQVQDMVKNKKPASFDLFAPRPYNTVPFTEPYDEG
ncbi:uncharacterized protein NECHADRAFT_77511 [Fusarium vanettenii 77-13-4]|uniref:Uncharacterized protein n=1 Tax=Fusarium vanettenii (strain ATCC MYA-4622 / CBS 123669 / FGSC 9596 / NRRL 45880 / 77-13-4) TaxID=660122 RepID=C7YLF3_FUSV7|nr:uncharacterized protein NECHADRAFT_77511 [Fusarium vanettenii 77-13-4]EEU47250.1 predicted protein [Fusarium vanettenii 77-13-4]